MRILHVITNLETGGAEKLLVDLLPFFAKENTVELALFVGNRTPFFEKIEAAGIKIHVFADCGSVYNPSNIWKLFKLSKGFDIVHTHNTSPQLYGALVSVFRKAKFCTTEHTTTSHHRTWWFKPVEKWMYGRYSSIICISEAAKQNVLLVAPSCKNRMCVVPNGIDISVYKNAQPVSKEGLVSKENDKIVLMVGRYSYQKDQATIIKAMPLLADDVELWLAGYGETHEKLQDLANTLNVAERVHLLGLRTDVPNLLKASDIVVQSSHIEGFGLAAVEAMAAGKPVIASNVEGLSGVVEGAGLLFEHENAQQLAYAISNVLNDKKQYQSLVEKGCKRASIYTIETMADKYLMEYKRVNTLIIASRK